MKKRKRLIKKVQVYSPKVFSIYKYLEACKKADHTTHSWANVCDGLTEKGMCIINKSTSDSWMIAKVDYVPYKF